MSCELKELRKTRGFEKEGPRNQGRPEEKGQRNRGRPEEDEEEDEEDEDDEEVWVSDSSEWALGLRRLSLHSESLAAGVASSGIRKGSGEFRSCGECTRSWSEQLASWFSSTSSVQKLA